MMAYLKSILHYHEEQMEVCTYYHSRSQDHYLFKMLHAEIVQKS